VKVSQPEQAMRGRSPVRESAGQTPDQPDQRFGITGSADPQPVTTCEGNLDQARRKGGIDGGCAIVQGVIDDVDGKEAGRIRHCQGLRRVAQPLEDPVEVHRMALRSARN